MKRIALVAGNWKMNKTAVEAVALVNELNSGTVAPENVEVLVCPPYLALPATADALKGSGIMLGAQNIFWEEGGAFTGEISPAMLKEFCCYVIIGHSERRAFFGETDETVNRRLHAAIKHGLKPIVCVGETLAENEAGETKSIVKRQIEGGLADLSAKDAADLVVAYEPVWAIGTGKAATSAGANEVIVYIRGICAGLLGAEIAAGMRILYGGSIKAGNAAEFFGMSDIDGGLVGGASLKATDFNAIIRAAG